MSLHCACSIKTPQFGQNVVSGNVACKNSHGVVTYCCGEQLGKGLPTSLESGSGPMKVEDGLNICRFLLEGSCGMIERRMHGKGCRAAREKHGAHQPPSCHFMGKHEGTIEIELRSPGRTQVCYESGLKSLK